MDPEEQKLKFKHDLTSMLLRWQLESDIDLTDMVGSVVEVINEVLGDGVIEFDADPEFLDKLPEEEE
tara:strand:+ start:1722 stop:1922 length:201 start_codon:yes stop_codon:yes gene_type:complete